jgi:hypothetical protein
MPTLEPGMPHVHILRLRVVQMTLGVHRVQGLARVRRNDDVGGGIITIGITLLIRLLLD